MNKWKEFRQSFEYKVIFRWVFWSELIAMLFTLLTFTFDNKIGGEAAWKYVGLREEGVKMLRIEDWFEQTNIFEGTVDYVSCSVTLDEEKYTFTERARDVFGNDDPKNKASVLVLGRLFSSFDRKNFFFTYTIYYGKEMARRNLANKFEATFRASSIWRSILYVVTFLYLLMEDKSKKTKYSKYLDQKKQNQYPEDIMKLSKNLKRGEFRVTADLAEAIGKFCYAKKEPEKKEDDDENLFVDPRAYGKRLMSDAMGRYMAQDVYRMHREPEYNYEKDSELLQDERDDNLNATNIPEYGKMPDGPIWAKQAVAKEAILISVERQQSQSRGKVTVLEYSRFGRLAQISYDVEVIHAREMTGNYVLVVRDGRRYGIYEDVLKNQKNPIMLDYDERGKQVRRGQWIYNTLLWIHFFASLFLLILAWHLSREWLIFPEIATCLFAVKTYQYLVRGTDRCFEKKHGSLIFYSMFQRHWGTPYFFLHLIMFIMIFLKCKRYGFF